MEPKQYISEIVWPTISEFEANPTSRRHAFLACVVTFHVIDYIYDGKPSSKRKSLRRESADFSIVDRVAHAFKHVSTGHVDSDIKPLNASDVIARPPSRLGALVLGLSRLGDPFGGVTLTADKQIDLLTTVKNAAEFLESKIV